MPVPTPFPTSNPASTKSFIHSGSGAPRALVVGGGIAGLAAAWHLRRAGVAVTLLEGAAALGGRAATRDVQGFSFNVGPHALYRRGELRALLETAGVSYEAGAPPNERAFGLYAGEVVPMPASLLAIAGSRFLGWRDKAQLLKFFARLRGVAPESLAGSSLAQFLDDAVSTPKSRAFAEAFFRVATYANAPRQLDAVAAVRQAQRALAGVFYVAGGWQSLIGGLVGVLLRQGVDILKGAKVAQVLAENGAARGVVLPDGRTLAADLVVLAVPPQVAVRLLPEAAATRLAQGLEGGIAARAACLDLAIENLPRPERLFALGFDQPIYYSVHSAATRLAPAGKVLLHVARYLEPEETSRRADVEAGLEAQLDLLQPGWRELELHRQLLPQMVVQESLPQVGHERPGVDAAALPGLRLAGDWVSSPALLADAAAESAARAAEQLLAEAGLGQDAGRRTA